MNSLVICKGLLLVSHEVGNNNDVYYLFVLGEDCDLVYLVGNTFFSKFISLPCDDNHGKYL
jgi:hypothetical protein